MAAVIASGSDSHSRVEPSTSLSRNVTVPTGRWRIDCSTLPTSSGGSPSISAYPAPAQLSLHWFLGGASSTSDLQLHRRTGRDPPSGHTGFGEHTLGLCERFTKMREALVVR